jgi:DNA-binding transcriptional MerR regulator
MTDDDDYAENEARRLRSITAVADLVRAVAEKSQIYGLNEEESVAINTLQKQVAEQARARLEEIFDTLEEARQRNQRRKIVKAAKRVARVQWRRAGAGMATDYAPA